VTQYQTVLSSLDIGESLLQCALGNLRVPLEDVEAPAEWFCFPPALIPILANGSGPEYWGIWMHWFVERKPTFVRLSVEGKFVIEVARSVEQFFRYLILSAIVDNDGVTPKIQQFAQSVGVHNLEEIDQISLDSGDDPRGLRALPEFCSNLPLESIATPDEYNGDFPVLLSNGSIRTGDLSCEFEIASDVLKRAKNLRDNPSWINNGLSRRAHFEVCLREGRLGDAWLALNSRGWSISDARQAIMKLSDTAGDPSFSVLANSWLSIADTNAGGY
jgi:hypothetical protein